jgi:hypothetical protein
MKAVVFQPLTPLVDAENLDDREIHLLKKRKSR